MKTGKVGSYPNVGAFGDLNTTAERTRAATQPQNSDAETGDGDAVRIDKKLGSSRVSEEALQSYRTLVEQQDSPARSQKVAELAQQVRSGSYQVDTQKVAQAVVNELFG